MRIFLMTDMEGCAGVLDHDNWVVPSGRWFETGRRILTEETNAAVDGFFGGGATDVRVVDGHGACGIDPLLLDERAELFRGHYDRVWPFGLDGEFDGVAWVGQHAKSGTDFSHITHTQSFGVLDISLNGVSVGEYGQLALCAMEFGVPSVFASGEEALCREAEALTPGVVTTSVKRGVRADGLDHLSKDEYAKAKLAAVHLHHAEACRRIRAGAAEAAVKLGADPGAFAYPEITPPYEWVYRYRADGDTPPRVLHGTDPESVTAALNSPLENRVRA